MNSTTGVEQLQDLGKTVGSMGSGIPTKMRVAGNLGMKAALVGEAAVVGKNLGIAPEVSTALVSVAERVPNILKITSELPGTQDFVQAAINSSRFLSELAGDMNTAVNLGMYGSVFALIYFIGRLGFGEKGRFEAGTSAVVWTALTVGLFIEMADVFKGYGHDIISWLPLRAIESMPDGLRDSMLDADSRRNMYAGVTGIAGFGTGIMASKNLKRLMLGIPKKKKKKTKK